MQRTLTFAISEEVRTQDTGAAHFGTPDTAGLTQDGLELRQGPMADADPEAGHISGDPRHRRRARELLLEQRRRRRQAVFRQEPGSVFGTHAATGSGAHRVVHRARGAPVASRDHLAPFVHAVTPNLD